MKNYFGRNAFLETGRKEVFNNGKFHENFQNKLNATAASDIILHYYLTSIVPLFL